MIFEKIKQKDEFRLHTGQGKIHTFNSRLLTKKTSSSFRKQ